MDLGNKRFKKNDDYWIYAKNIFNKSTLVGLEKIYINKSKAIELWKK